ncbi:hypothetical protein WJX81_004963 [Elliptochloris bilobata]|uniref:Uncharacterized protein n=1 Tax=Elliptochloris bilobata TaxID=381761 RepID=A0AAW1RJT7_9CHLO
MHRERRAVHSKICAEDWLVAFEKHWRTPGLYLFARGQCMCRALMQAFTALDVSLVARAHGRARLGFRA